MTSNNNPTQQNMQDVQALFTAQGGGLSQTSSNLLVQNLTPAIYTGTQGISPHDLGGDKVFLFVPVLDMTGSMSLHRNVLVTAYNEMVEALKESKQADDILMSSWTFNDKSYPLHKYAPLEYVPKLTKQVYKPDGATALYDAVFDAVTGVVAYGEHLRQHGARTKIVLVVFTDGEDNVSTHTAQQVRKVVKDLLAQEMYTFALVAFGGGYAKNVADAMGFEADNVLEVEHVTPSSIRHALDTVSKSMIRQSQTIITGSGGFFQP